MASALSQSEGKVVAFIDLGTYAVRLLLVRLNANQSFTVLSEVKESVRLGRDEFHDNKLQPEPMRQAAHVLARLAEMARSFGAEEIVAVATSATREAANQRDFVRRVREQAGVTLRVVSGKEEARLVYLGVSRGMNLAGKTGLFIDIGGGSTELAVGDEHTHAYLDSLKLGTIRLSQMFGLDEPTRPIAAGLYGQVCRYVRSASVRTLQHVRDFRFGMVVGSSGTLRNLARIAAEALHGAPAARDPGLTRSDLREVVRLLCAAPLPERRKLPGIAPERADILVGGAAIIDVLMEDLRIEQLVTSRRGLRDGLLVHYLAESEHADLVTGLATRRRSVLLLGRACGFDEQHAENVTHLALQLFDSAGRCGLHGFGERERELLEYAALLHDVGVFLSFVDHQAHSYYLIRHTDLLGFDQTEIAIIAALARYHRKGTPAAGDAELAELDKRGVEVVTRLFALLRLAESLERSHSGVVRRVRLQRVDSGTIALQVTAAGDCTLELWAVERHARAFSRAFELDLVINPPKAEPTPVAVAQS